MTQLDLYKRFNHAHAVIVVNIENYVRENGGHIRCNKTLHMRYMDSMNADTRASYKFDHIYMRDGECIVAYTEDTELSCDEIELNMLTCDELNDLINDMIERHPYKNGNWSRYIDYLHEWADSHAGSVHSGMSPVSFDEWMDNEREVCK